MALLQLEALTVNASGGTWFDFTTSTPAAATAPTGSGAWSDVAGGATVAGPDGSSYIIGGTRLTGAASASVLVVNADGSLAYAQLKAPRLGAAAGWVNGVGLVIAGGSGAAGAAGIEVIGGPLVTTAIGIPYPPDATTGAGLDALDATHTLLVGGTSARVVDLSCTSSCAAVPWGATLPTPLAFTQVFAIDASSAFVVGEDASGAMHAYRMSSALVQEVAFKVPRNHARAVRLPTGAVAVVGGAPSMESFVP
jgi:hypothetical protein